jgi:CubicO group peptidase (beta-lactamase class C family)
VYAGSNPALSTIAAYGNCIHARLWHNLGMKALTPTIMLVLTSCATTEFQPRSFRPAEARVAFDAKRVVSATASGEADYATHRRATVDDPVRVASISKLVVALGVMRLVEAGTLDLDRDVSDYLGWPVRNPAFSDKPITLRHLLSHTSGLRDGVDYTIPYGGTVRSTLADAKAWEPAHPPGTYFTYANVGFPVIASIMEKVTAERFDRLMARLVFTPLKLDVCFNWMTCSDGKVARHIVLYNETGGVRRDDLHGKRPDCPVFTRGGCDLSTYTLGENGALFSPQGGLRISMRDLARIGQMLLQRGDGFLKPESIDAMTAAQWTYDGSNGDVEGGFYCSYGLAVQRLATVARCNDDVFGDGKRRIGHAGEAYGLRSGLWINPVSGTGVAYFSSALADDAPRGQSAYTQVEERQARGR